MRLFIYCLLIATVTFTTASVSADQNIGQPPQPEKDPGFFQRASNNVGGFFKRVFKSDEQYVPPPPAPQRYKSRSRSQRYSLDQAPSELRETQPSSTRPNTPPTTATTAKNTGKPRSTASTANTGSPAIQDPPKPRTQKVTPAETSRKTVATETTTRPKTTRPPETTPETNNTGGVLYSNTETAVTKQPDPPAKTETESMPTPPKAPTETSNVLTGSKTGKVGRVKSPYAPYSELDVTGLPSGSLALDPTTQKVFRIP